MRTAVLAAAACAALCGGAAPEVVPFRDAAKIRSWDAWKDHEKSAPRRERPCVTWNGLNRLDPGLRELGRLAVRDAKDVRSSKWSVGCETLDRDYADWNAYKAYLGPLGAKHGRLFSGWAKTEQERGRYDFSWLDPQVREMAAMGVKPWICLSYGNPAWGSDFRLGMRVRQVTGNPEAFEAWLRYCTACVERYKDVVDEWEIWNEPFHQGPEYAELFYRTARAVRAVQPEARCFCTAVTFPDDYKCVLERLKGENALDLGSYFIYHPYVGNPDDAFRKRAEGLLKLVRSYSPSFNVMQGEAGCPAQLEFAHALKGVEWSECSQAKWDLRRTVDDAAHGIPCNVFTMIDLQYTFMLQSFGLIRSNTLKEFVYRRPSYFAMQNVFGYIDDDVKPQNIDCNLGYRLESRFDPRDTAHHTLKAVRFSRGGRPVRFYWFSDRMPTRELGFDRVTFKVPGELHRLVWVEMITGRVFEVPESSISREGGKTVLSSLPMWDSPVMVAEPEAVPLRKN
ncbi:MAG: glycoside hydrolase [Kiritimatiellae bacterium]|nr:glycoside hydrolase [Kiritimatiellia bacterium]